MFYFVFIELSGDEYKLMLFHLYCTCVLVEIDIDCLEGLSFIGEMWSVSSNTVALGKR